VTDRQLGAGEMDRHLRRMRLTTVLFMVTVPLAVAVVLVVEPRGGSTSPMVVSLVAAAAALWIGFSANRDAGARLGRIRRAYAVHGDPSRLLADLRLVHLVVLARLEVMVLAGVVAAVVGDSRAVAWGVLALAGLMIALAWPTADKTHMLLERAREQRGR